MTTMFGLDRAEVERLVRAVAAPAPRASNAPAPNEPGFTHDDLTTGDLDDLFARSTWTCLAEPGDRLAGVLIATLGAARALQAVIDRLPAEQLAAQLGEHDVDPSIAAELRQGLDRWLPRLRHDTATRALQQAARFDIGLLTPSHELWPVGLNDLGAHAPVALWLRGRWDALRGLDASIALVGARAATGYGEHITMEASAGLVDRGYTIVSGAAYGIDGMAHRAALASRGTTLAFLAGGLDRFYPSGHEALLGRIVETGAVLSEVPCGTPPTKWRFLQRNRLIAAASQATVVLEAGWRSGSLNTAGHASTLGRPLGAVPGPVTSAASAGCHRLIREYDAVCVTNPDEMAELAPLGSGAARPLGVEAAGAETAGVRGPEKQQPVGEGVGGKLEQSPSAESTEQSRLIDALSARSPRSALDLARRSGLSVTTVQALLGVLELEGRAHERERGWLTRAK